MIERTMLAEERLLELVHCYPLAKSGEVINSHSLGITASKIDT